MPVELWIALFLINSLVVYWVVFRGGAERLEGSFLAALFLHSLAPRWSADGLKVFAGLSWIVSAIWFVVALFEPALRLW